MGEMVKNRKVGEDITTGGPTLGVGQSSMMQSPMTPSAPQGDVSGRQVIEEAKEAASSVAGQAKEAVSGQVSRKAEQSAGDIEQVARALRRTKEELSGNLAAPYVEKAAEKLEDLSDFLRNTNATEIVRGVEGFARREPLLFLGGAFALGILGARFLKSSAHHGRPGVVRGETSGRSYPSARPRDVAGYPDVATREPSSASHSGRTAPGGFRVAEGTGKPS